MNHHVHLNTKELFEVLREVLHSKFSYEGAHTALTSIVRAKEESELALNYMVDHLARGLMVPPENLGRALFTIFVDEGLNVERLISMVECPSLGFMPPSGKRRICLQLCETMIEISPLQALKIRLAWEKVTTYQMLLSLGAYGPVGTPVTLDRVHQILRILSRT